MQDVDPALLYLPFAQAKQLVAARDKSVYFPATQRTQPVAPEDAAYFPASQLSHVDNAGTDAYFP